MSDQRSNNKTFPTIQHMIDNMLECGDVVWVHEGIHYAIASGRDINGKRTWDFQYKDEKTMKFVFPEYGNFYTIEDAINAKIINVKSLVDLFDVADFSDN